MVPNPQMDSYEHRILVYASRGSAELKQFECVTPKGSKAFSVIRVRRYVESVEVEKISIPRNTLVFSFREQGAIGVRHLSDRDPLVATFDTIGFYAPGEYLTLSGVGEQKYTLLVAHVLESSIVMDYVNESATKFSVHRISPTLRARLDEMVAQCDEPGGLSYLSVAALFHLGLEVCLREKCNLNEGAIPAGLPEGLRSVCQRVTESPGENWTVSLAAELAGLSSHYFSRTFKQLYGDGFPGYVQTVRLNKALQLVSEGVLVAKDLADQSGFASTQGLRDAFKTRLGLLPSDLQSLYTEQQAQLRQG